MLKKSLYYTCSLLLVCIPFDETRAQEVTWANAVACIVYSHCTPCHNNTGIAPFSLNSYDDTYRSRHALKEAVAKGDMPPWPPSQHFGPIAGNRSLSDEEIKLLEEWVENGAPEGDPDLAPEAPEYSSVAEITDPDISIQLPTYEIPDARELDLYRCFVIPTNESEDRFIKGIEIIPGNRKVVHHVILFQDTTGAVEQLDDQDPGLGYTCFGGPGSNQAAMLSGWVPGSSATFTPEGMGIRLPKGASLIAQIHYPEGSVGEKDSTVINIEFSDEDDVREILILPALNHFTNIDRPLFIPANTKQKFTETFFPVPVDLILTGVAPHAHLICESMKAYAISPLGDTIPIIDIPHWDFEWQGFYTFSKPVHIPALSTVYGEATYNNTTTNHHLPDDIPRDVHQGEATTDEMMIFFFSIALYEKGDENTVFDDREHKEHYLECEAGQTLSDYSHAVKYNVSVYPNPTNGEFAISGLDRNQSWKLELYNSQGIKVFENPIWNKRVVLPQVLRSGVYFGKLIEPNHGHRMIKIHLWR